MPLIRFDPEVKNKAFSALLWERHGSFRYLPEDIFDVSESDLNMLKERGIAYRVVLGGTVTANGNWHNRDANHD